MKQTVVTSLSAVLIDVRSGPHIGISKGQSTGENETGQTMPWRAATGLTQA